MGRNDNEKDPGGYFTSASIMDKEKHTTVIIRHSEEQIEELIDYLEDALKEDKDNVRLTYIIKPHKTKDYLVGGYFVKPYNKGDDGNGGGSYKPESNASQERGRSRGNRDSGGSESRSSGGRDRGSRHVRGERHVAAVRDAMADVDDGFAGRPEG